MLERFAPHATKVLTHAVENHDRVVDGITGDRQDRRDDVERQVVAEERQECERHEDVVQGRRNRANGKCERKRNAM